MPSLMKRCGAHGYTQSCQNAGRASKGNVPVIIPNANPTSASRPPSAVEMLNAPMNTSITQKLASHMNGTMASMGASIPAIHSSMQNAHRLTISEATTA